MKLTPQCIALIDENSSRSAASLRAFLASGAALWLALAVLALILFHGLIYQGYPRSPSVQITAGKMIFDALLCALPGALLGGALGFALPRGSVHLLACGGAYLAGLWYGRELVGSIYRDADGSAWAFGEAARELVWHPLWVPVLMVAGLAAQIGLSRWLWQRELRRAGT